MTTVQGPVPTSLIPTGAGLYFLAGRGYEASRGSRKVPVGRASL